MYVIKIKDTKTNEAWLYQTIFNVNLAPGIVLYDTVEQANADVETIQQAAKEDLLALSFEVIDLKTIFN